MLRLALYKAYSFERLIYYFKVNLMQGLIATKGLKAAHCNFFHGKFHRFFLCNFFHCSPTMIFTEKDFESNHVKVYEDYQYIPWKLLKLSINIYIYIIYIYISLINVIDLYCYFNRIVIRYSTYFNYERKKSS